MKKFIVSVREVHIQMVEVEAENEEEAKDKVLAGDGVHRDDSLEFSHTLDSELWTVEETAWGSDKSHAPDCAYRNKGECTCPKSEPKKQFAVYVEDKRSVKYIVDADSDEDAQRMVENSDDADEEFGGKSLDGSEWYVDQVEEC